MVGGLRRSLYQVQLTRRPNAKPGVEAVMKRFRNFFKL